MAPATRMTLLGAAIVAVAASTPARGDDAPFPVSIRVDAGRPGPDLKPIWRFFGADEPNYATMRDGKKLLAELGELRPGSVYFRAHNLLTTGDGTPALKWGSTNAYTEDRDGRPVYDWTIVDAIFDAYLARGVRPYVQIGFMPQALSTRPDPYQHRWTPQAKYDEIYTGWAYPPKEYDRWGELVYQWVTHCVAKYGRAEVEAWYWETWNEANIGYWRGTPAEFRKLHDYSIAAVRRALPTARVGGADSAGSGGRWTRDFLEHQLRGTNAATGRVGTPIDFVSFHAKGAPSFVDGRVRMGIAEQLRTIDDGFRLVASFPELKDRPIIIGESDPDGCAACQGPQLGYRNTTMYSSYTAASFARIHDLADRRGVNIEGALTWAFEFEDQPLFAGFRALATGGIDLPVLNTFRMMARLRGPRLPVASDGSIPLDAILRDGVRTRPDVGALATRPDPDHLAILLWHYHDEDAPGPEAAIALEIAGIPDPPPRIAAVLHYRVDATHGNAHTAWRTMGSPASPTPDQYAQLERSSRDVQGDADGGAEARTGEGRIILSIPLSRQAVSLIEIDLKHPKVEPLKLN